MERAKQRGKLVSRPRTTAPPCVGLALGGGAVRGIAHIGVLKVLEEEGIPVGCVAGTSVGSLIGAAFCAGWSWREILERARSVTWSDIVSPTLPWKGLMRIGRLQRLLENTFGDLNLEDLHIPLSVVTVDITKGEQVVLCQGSVARAVRASCSIPGIFEPLVEDGRSLVDGGLVNSIPADVARQMGAGVVIGVDLNPDRRHLDPPQNVFGVLSYAWHILLNNGANQIFAEADIIVAPRVGSISYWSLGKTDKLVALGESAMRSEIGRLKERLSAERETV